MEEKNGHTPVGNRTRAMLRLLDLRLWKLVRKYYTKVVGVCFLGGLVLGLWSVFVEPSMLKVTTASITPRRWPRELDGFKVVAISDLHAGSPFVDMKKVDRIVELANAQEPDLTVLLGDYVIDGIPGGSFISPIDFAPVLGKLKARTGVYAILGNHDWHYGGAAVAKAFEEAGIKVIDNTHRELMYKGAAFSLVGIGDCFTAHDNLKKAYDGIDTAKATINITHTPDVFARLPEWADIMFAGHTHGGQVNLPIVGRLVIPSNFGQRYAIGHVREGERDLYVTSGIGTSILPIRFRVPPEIAVITLKASS